MDDILLNKAVIIERYLRRMKEEYRACIAVHEYQNLNLDIVRYVIKKGYKDFILFCETLGIRIQVE